MIRPTPRALLLLAAGLPLALLAVVAGEAWWQPWALMLAASVGVVLFDAWACLRPGQLVLEVGLPEQLFVGASRPLRVSLAAPAGRGLGVELLAAVDELLARPAPCVLELPADGGAVHGEIALVPVRRGRTSVDALWLRWRSPLALVERIRRHPLGRSLPVLPDTPGVRAAALALLGSPAARAGLKVERFVGEGSEFDALRRHVAGLDPRSIDWKASARHGALLSRRYRAERNHQVVLALDCGQLMGEPLAGLSRLDRSIHAALLLATVALHTGDRVGLFAFDSAPRAYVAPRAGGAHLARLRDATAALGVADVASNPTRCLLELDRQLSRRALVVVITDSADDITARLMVEQVGRLARRHLVLFVTLIDPDLEQLSLTRPSSLSDLGRAVVADELAQERARVIARVRRAGAAVLEARHDELPSALVNRYLSIMRREQV